MSSGPVVLVDGRVKPRGLPIYKDSGFILMMDALGTKGIWKILPPEVFYRRWETVQYFIQDTMNSNIGQNFDVYSFSDTLIITISLKLENIHIDLITNLGQTISNILKMAFNNDVFLRGSISIGKFYKSHKFVIGPAIDDAANCYEEADLIGIIASNTLGLFFDGLTNKQDVFPFVKSIIPTKNKSYNLWTLNWNFNNDSKIIDRLQEKMNQYRNENISKKYRNTINLFTRQ